MDYDEKTAAEDAEPKPDEGELEFPDDIPLEPGRPAEAVEPIRPSQKAATEEFVNVRMKALSNLMQVSMEPAIALMPVSKRKQISTAFGEFEALVEDGQTVKE